MTGKTEWGVYPVRAKETARGKQWVLRYRIDGATRQRTFSTKGYADEAKRCLERARALGLPADAKGWPLEQPAAPEVAPARTPTADPRTFAEYAEQWLQRNQNRWAPGGRGAHGAALLAASLLLRLQPGDSRFAGGDRSIRLCDMTLGDLERAINDRHRINFAGRAGEAVRDEALRTGERVRLADGVVASPRSVRAFSISLGMVIKKAQAEGLVPDGTWAGVDRVRSRQPVLGELRQVPSIDEVLALAEAVAGRGPCMPVSGRPRGERLRAAVLLCGTSGLRPGEAAGLLSRDVHLDGPEPHVVLRQTLRRYSEGQRRFPGPDLVLREDGWGVRPLKHRAPGVTRQVPVHPRALAALRSHQAAHAGPEFFFSTPTGRGVLDWHNVVQAYWLPAVRTTFVGDRSFLAGISPKMLRKAALTDLLRLGVSPYVVAEIAGHDPATLMKHYAGVIARSEVLSVWQASA